MNKYCTEFQQPNASPREAQEGKDERDEAAVDQAPQDLLLLRRVRRVPGRRLAAETADQDGLLVAEAVEAELAMVGAHPALADSAEWQMWVGELHWKVEAG